MIFTRHGIWVIVLLFFVSCNFTKSKNQDKEANRHSDELTNMNFESEIHDFGKLKSGEVVIFAFVYTNTGDKNLIIRNVQVDCGCVNTKYSTKPVKPGGKGIVEVTFDSSGLFGNQFKTINVEANVSETKHLAIFAKVNNDQLEITY